MCEKCDHFLDELYRQVSDGGFTVIPVGRSIEEKGWAYTIGLIDGYNHPELVVAGRPLREAVEVLSALGNCVVRGDRIDTPGQHGLNGAPIGVVPIHRRHIDGDLMNFWQPYYDRLARFDLVLEALQIVLPAGGCCFEHQTEQPDLGSACHVPFDGMGPRGRRRAHGPPAVGAGRRREARSRSQRPEPFAPPATMEDIYRYRRSTRRRR